MIPLTYYLHARPEVTLDFSAAWGLQQRVSPGKRCRRGHNWSDGENYDRMHSNRKAKNRAANRAARKARKA